MLSVWCLVPGNYPTARRLRPLRSLLEDRTIAEKSIDLILSRYLYAMKIIFLKGFLPRPGYICPPINTSPSEIFFVPVGFFFDKSRHIRGADLFQKTKPSSWFRITLQILIVYEPNIITHRKIGFQISIVCVGLWQIGLARCYKIIGFSLNAAISP